jgi:hypothetical protein
MCVGFRVLYYAQQIQVTHQIDGSQCPDKMGFNIQNA